MIQWNASAVLARGNGGRRQGWFTIFVAALTLALSAPCDRAAAQGTDGALADPISTRELMGYADRLGLSPQQRLALESVHDEYKREFRELREGEIAEFMSQTGAMAGFIPKRDVVEKLLDDMQKLQDKIKRVDDRLMDRIQPLLTEDQLAMMTRIRDRRERQRYATVQTQQMMTMSGRRPVDISDLYAALDLDPDVVVATDPTIAAYERKLTNELRKIDKAIFTIYLDMFDAIEAAGFGDLDMTDGDMDPEEMQRFGEAMQGIWVELLARIGKMAGAINNLDQITMRSVASMLPPEKARELKDQYYSRAYPEAMFAIVSSTEANWLDDLLGLEVLTDAEREAITLALGELRRKLDRTLDQAIELTDEQRATFSMFSPDVEAYQKHEEKMSELREEAAVAMSDAMSMLAEVIDPSRLAEIRKAALAEGAGGEVEITGESPVDGPEPEPTEEQLHWSGDMFLAPRISKRDVSGYARKLGLEEGQREVLMSMLADYVVAYDASKEISDLSDANANLWQWDEDTGTASPPSDAAIDRLTRSRKSAVDALRALDSGFFDRVAIYAGEEKVGIVDRLRRNRERSMYLSAQTASYFTMQGGSEEGSIDLVALVEEARLPDEELADVDAILSRYEAASLDLLRARFESQLALQRETERWTAASQRVNADGQATMDWPKYQEVMGPLNSKIVEATKSIAELNRTHLEEIVAALAASNARSVRRTFARRAFPSVYEDPASVDEQLAAALELEDLTQEQRDKLADVAAGYRPEYEELSRKMIEFAREGYDFSNFEMSDFQAYQEKQRELAKLGYDRDELSFRARNRLRAILTEGQVRRIGGLPDPPAEEDLDFFP